MQLHAPLMDNSPFNLDMDLNLDIAEEALLVMQGLIDPEQQGEASAVATPGTMAGKFYWDTILTLASRMMDDLCSKRHIPNYLILSVNLNHYAAWFLMCLPACSSANVTSGTWHGVAIARCCPGYPGFQHPHSSWLQRFQWRSIHTGCKWVHLIDLATRAMSGLVPFFIQCTWCAVCADDNLLDLDCRWLPRDSQQNLDGAAKGS